MIRRMLGLFLGVSCLQAVYGATYSKVYVQNGAEFFPVEYVKYGAPRVVTNGQIAALSTPPIGSALPLPNVVTPCVAPCVLPSQVGTFAPVPNAKIIYNAPSAPAVIVPTNDEKSSYEYSYIVYDEDTGDKKAQRELSDGSVVQGEYSFIQPDGYIREVKYTADDLTGFNAVVKSFLPESVSGMKKNKPEMKKTSKPPPCKETKIEALKVAAEQPKLEPSEAQAAPESNNVDAQVELSVVPVDHAPAEYDAENVISPEDNHPSEQASSHAGETPAEHAAEQAPENVSENAPKQATGIKPKNVPDQAIEAQPNRFEIIVETPAEHAKHGPHHAVVAKPVELVAISPDSTLASAVELIQPPTKEDSNQQTHATVQAPNPQVSIPNGLATYSDILRCIQAAMANKDANAPNISPLTYIILPGANKPC